MKNYFLIAALLLSIFPAFSQSLVPLPPAAGSWTGQTRGYWFTAPVDFTIVGIRVPTAISSGPQSVAILKLAAVPPLIPSFSSGYTTEYLAQGIAGNDILLTNVNVSAGEIIGILGSRGPNAANSYSAAAAPFASAILGMPIQLNRFFTQVDLQSVWPAPVTSSPPGFQIGLVELYVSSGPPIPTMSEWGLILFGLLLFNMAAVGMYFRKRLLASV